MCRLGLSMQAGAAHQLKYGRLKRFLMMMKSFVFLQPVCKAFAGGRIMMGFVTMR